MRPQLSKLLASYTDRTNQLRDLLDGVGQAHQLYESRVAPAHPHIPSPPFVNYQSIGGNMRQASAINELPNPWSGQAGAEMRQSAQTSLAAPSLNLSVVAFGSECSTHLVQSIWLYDLSQLASSKSDATSSADAWTFPASASDNTAFKLSSHSSHVR